MAHRRAKGKTGTAASPVEVTRPAEGLWKMVKDLGIPRNHVQRHRDGAITIWNHPAPWPGSERGK